jgi:hypothetical protein
MTQLRNKVGAIRNVELQIFAWGQIFNTNSLFFYMVTKKNKAFYMLFN